MSKTPTFAYLPVCDPGTPQGTMATLKLSQLRPTQNAVGMDEINNKVARLTEKSGAKLEDYLLERPIPVIIGRTDKFYLIDHHHLAVSVLQSHGDIVVPVEVVRNWAPIKGFHFWKAMSKQHWLYPFAADGGGPVSVGSMAKHIDELGNDIYRSIAWVARTHYAYVKSADNAIFAEFKWANFFRARLIPTALFRCKDDCESVTLADIEKADPEGYQEMALEGRYLAKSPEARGMPGYIGPG
jgi:hypothetical protein